MLTISPIRSTRVLVVVVGIIVCGLPSACAPVSRAPREIVVITKGMTFMLPDVPDTANPVIPMRAGEQVKVVLRNEAPGLLHDFVIPAWNVQTPQIKGGETTEVIFTVPSTPGRTEYLCRPHAKLMNGFVEVTP